MAFNDEYTYSFQTSNNWFWRLKIHVASASTVSSWNVVNLPGESIRIKTVEYGWEKAPIGLPENLTMDLTVNLDSLAGSSELVYLKEKLIDSFEFSGGNLYYNSFILEYSFDSSTWNVFSITAQKPTIERIFTPAEIIKTLDVSTVCVVKLTAETLDPKNLALELGDEVEFEFPTPLVLYDYVFTGVNPSATKRILSTITKAFQGDSKIEAKSIINICKRLGYFLALGSSLKIKNAGTSTITDDVMDLFNYDFTTALHFFKHKYEDDGKADLTEEIPHDELFVMTKFFNSDGTEVAGWCVDSDSESWNRNYKNVHNALQDSTEGMFCKGVYKCDVFEGGYYGYLEFSKQLSEIDIILNFWDISSFDNLKITQGNNIIRNAKFNIKERSGGNITEFERDNIFSRAENDFNLKNVCFNVTPDNVNNDGYSFNSTRVSKRKVVGSKLYYIDEFNTSGTDYEQLIRVGDAIKIEVDEGLDTFQPTDDFNISVLNNVDLLKIEIAKRQQQGSIFYAVTSSYLKVFGDYRNADIEGTVYFNSVNPVGADVSLYVPYNIGKRIELFDSTELTEGIKNTSDLKLIPTDIEDLGDSKCTLKKVLWNFEEETIDLTIFVR